ncbi:FKBP-type peptidyl-prolyl cis-trans isomerase [uncultured Sunxiuqinia sp.]|uniref:FKBP-type peptidyl-prolyl cis-trans isomerase n=1 Tax=uncultured Sunxiuqinia sp. TaxID=1573825 RepID=UPI002AA853C5|nr:FKBP-type peptidyl-prolyl cis-trans isomerase [uncultured Sunxiuqinia sp.]
MKKLFFFFALLGYALVAAVSCKNNGLDLEKLRAEELARLNEYIETNGITTEPTESGLYYIEQVKGTGDSIKVGDRVKIFYTGMLIDSTVFDASGNYEPLEFIVGSTDVITGMSEGVTYMTQGGKATFIIPSNLAYKATTSSGLPRFSTLIFDVEVYKHYKLSDTTN